MKTGQVSASCGDRDPIPAPRDLEARFAVVDHFLAADAYSELVEHALFCELGWCTCTRCRWAER